jgi:lysozyme family protein
MKPSFEVAFEWMIPHEDFGVTGKVTQEPGGGIAKYGINSKAYPHVDVRNLTEEQAKAIYLADFWNHFLVGEFLSQQVASKVFDMLVNLGHTAVKLLQEAVGAPVDGGMGSLTLSLANKVASSILIPQLCQRQAEHYRERAEKDPNYPLQGLLGRAACVPPKD